MVALHIPVTDYTISTDKNMLNMKWVIDELMAAPWGHWLTPEKIVESIAFEACTCFGIYRSIGDELDQIGFARVISDCCTFSSIMDVVIEEQYRKQGLGTALLTEVCASPQVKDTICIIGTSGAVLPASAARFYKKFGFHGADGVMTRDPT